MAAFSVQITHNTAAQRAFTPLLLKHPKTAQWLDKGSFQMGVSMQSMRCCLRLRDATSGQFSPFCLRVRHAASGQFLRRCLRVRDVGAQSQIAAPNNERISTHLIGHNERNKYVRAAV